MRAAGSLPSPKSTARKLGFLGVRLVSFEQGCGGTCAPGGDGERVGGTVPGGSTGAAAEPRVPGGGSPGWGLSASSLGGKKRLNLCLGSEMALGENPGEDRGGRCRGCRIVCPRRTSLLLAKLLCAA